MSHVVLKEWQVLSCEMSRPLTGGLTKSSFLGPFLNEYMYVSLYVLTS